MAAEEECYEKKKIFDSDDDGYDGGIHAERMRLRFQFREFRGNGNRGEHSLRRGQQCTEEMGMELEIHKVE